MSANIYNTITVKGSEKAVMEFYALALGFDEYVEFGKFESGSTFLHRRADGGGFPIPKTVIQILAKKFPAVTISLSYGSLNGGIQGDYVMKGKKVLWDKEINEPLSI